MKKLLLVPALAIALTACGEQNVVNAPIPTATTPASAQQYSLADVAKHNQSTDCWMAIHNKVYNVTTFVTSSQHPGGPVITQGCGKDATSLFENRPGEGDAHSNQARAMLPNFYIGELK